MFDHWENGPAHPTLFRVDRLVTVGAAVALPSDARKLSGQYPVWVRAFGLKIEPQMPGQQIAWVRRADGGWLALVLVRATSGNEHSRMTVPLWLRPSLVTTAAR